MRNFNEAIATDAVIQRMAQSKDPRFLEIISSVIRHLHGIVRDVEPTMEEWSRAIQFLTQCGQNSGDKRQEFILLSDTLGISMLLESINNRTEGDATEATVLGPFHAAAPDMAMGDTLPGAGEPTLVSGRIMDISDNPVSGARIDVWQTAGDGFYDVQRTGSDELNRGVFTTGDDGRYWFKTVKPVSYEVPTDGPVGDMLRQMNRDAWRPAHIHFMLTAPGYRKLTTHIFVESDPYLEDDAVFAVRESLIRTFTQIEDPDEIQRRGFDGPFWKVDSDFVLQPEAPG